MPNITIQTIFDSYPVYCRHKYPNLVNTLKYRTHTESKNLVENSLRHKVTKNVKCM